MEAGGIWKSMVTDAIKRGFHIQLKNSELSEAAKQFEMIDKDYRTMPELELKFTQLVSLCLSTLCIPRYGKL